MMKARLGFFAPSSLKNRLFLAFLLLIFLPYTFLQFNAIRRIEQSFERQIIRQNTEQLEQLKQTFEDLRSTVFRVGLRLERDPILIGVLNGGGGAEGERRKQLDGLWNEIKSRTLPSPYVFYSLFDHVGRQYASYSPGVPLTYESALARRQTADLRLGRTDYIWVPDDETDLRPEDSRSSRLLSLYSLVRDKQGNALGLIRISIDFQAWLSAMARSFPITQDFYLLNERGVVLGGTGDQEDDALTAFIRSSWAAEPSFRIKDLYLYNKMPVPAMQWTLVSRFPLQLIFGDTEQMRNQMASAFFLFTIVFIAITFFILSTLIRPLRLLQIKMADVADKQFITKLPTEKYKGEVLALARSFNKMVSDLHALLQRLKAEQRQREAVRLQMLLSQMNPHFLLNTLNVVKWNVLGKGDEETAQICVALGKLLETSLNEEEDLIHLRKERELTEAYVSIQSFRYDRSIEIRWEVDDRLQYTLVPKLSLQPLVENAIFHGLTPAGGAGLIWIRAYEEQGRCWLEVEDNGVGWNPNSPANAGRQRKGIGLKNIRERLDLLFKQEAVLEIEPLPSGTRVRLGFPLLVAAPFTEEGRSDVEGTAG